MAELRITAGLNAELSAAEIEKDLSNKVEPKLQAKAPNVKIVAGLKPTETATQIQKDLDKVIGQTKAPTIKVGIDISNQTAVQNISTGLKNVQAQAKQTANTVKQVTTSMTASDVSDKIVKEFQKTFNIIGEDAKNTAETFKELFAQLNNAWYTGNIKKYDEALSKIYETASKATQRTKEYTQETKDLISAIRGGLSDGSKVSIASDVKEELDYILGKAKTVQQVLNTVYGVGKWSYGKSGIGVDVAAQAGNANNDIQGYARAIVDAYNSIEEAKSKSPDNIFDYLGSEKSATEEINDQIRSIMNLSDTYTDATGSQHAYIEGLGWFEELGDITTDIQQTTESINDQAKVAEKASEKLKAIRESITYDQDGQQLGRTSVYGETGFTKTSRFDENDKLTSFTITEDFKKLEQESAKIEEVRAKYNRLLADFKSSNSAIQSGLTQPIQKFETVLNGLGKTSSINDVKNAFESLKQSASGITRYLETTNSSFNKATNAVNNYKNMDNILKEMTTSFDNLTIKPEELKTELDGVKAKLAELKDTEQSEGGFTEVWAQKYREVNLEVARVKTNIELALKAEGASQKADKNSAYQIQLKYLNKIKEETNTIISLKRKMVNVGDEEKSVYQHEITKAQKRIQYDVQQLGKKKLLTDEAKRLVNTYKEQIKLQDKINSAKTNDKIVKVQSQQLKNYVAQVVRAITQLNSLQSNTTFKNNASNPQVAQTKADITALIGEYQKLKTQLQGNVTPEGLRQIETTLTSLNSRFNTATEGAKNLQRSLADTNGIKKQRQQIDLLIARIEAYRKANPKAMKAYGSQIDSMLSELKSGNLDKVDVDRISKQFQTLRVDIQRADKAGKGFFAKLKDQALKFGSWMTLTGVITTLWHEVRKMVTNVIELDNSLLELSKVSDLTASGLKNITKEAYSLGKEVGKTGTQVIDAITNFKRAGFSIEDSTNFAEDALILTNVAEGINDAGEAATALISIMKGYDDTSSEFSQKILDSINEVSNTQAINFDDLVDGSQRLSAVAKQAGMSFEQMLGVLTGTNEVLQNIEKTATGEITIFTRLQAIQLPDEEDVLPLAKLQSTINTATKGAVDIVDQTTGQLRNVYDILDDINEVWDTLDKNTQEGIAFAAAGTRQKNVFLSMMENWENVENATNSAMDSMGSSAEENQKYLDSISGRLANLESSFQSLSNTVINSDLIKGAVDLGTGFLNVLDGIINKLGTIPTLLTAISAGLAFKNVGELLNTPVYAQPQLICA